VVSREREGLGKVKHNVGGKAKVRSQRKGKDTPNRRDGCYHLNWGRGAEKSNKAREDGGTEKEREGYGKRQPGCRGGRVRTPCPGGGLQSVMGKNFTALGLREKGSCARSQRGED